MKSVLTLILLGAAFNAAAACPVQRLGEAPAVPDGAVANHEAMYRAQREAEKFHLQAEAYMDCQEMNPQQQTALAEQVDGLRGRLNEEMIKFKLRRNTATTL